MVTRCFTADGSGTNQILCAYCNVTTGITCFFQSTDCKALMSTSTYCRSFIVSFSIFYAEEQRIC